MRSWLWALHSPMATGHSISALPQAQSKCRPEGRPRESSWPSQVLWLRRDTVPPQKLQYSHLIVRASEVFLSSFNSVGSHRRKRAPQGAEQMLPLLFQPQGPAPPRAASLTPGARSQERQPASRLGDRGTSLHHPSLVLTGTTRDQSAANGTQNISQRRRCVPGAALPTAQCHPQFQ